MLVENPHEVFESKWWETLRFTQECGDRRFDPWTAARPSVSLDNRPDLSEDNIDE